MNEYGNAYLDENGEFVKMSDQGMMDDLWSDMVAFAKSKELKGGNYKKLNLPFENRLFAQPRDIRERMVKGVEDFVYELLTEVFNAGDTAPLAIAAILEAGSHDVGPKSVRRDDPAEWTDEKILERAAKIGSDKGPDGNFED